MKIRHLLVAGTLGLIGTASAWAGYGEGTMGADLVALQQQASIPGPVAAATTAYAPGEGSNVSTYDLLAARQWAAGEPGRGVAGPAGRVMDEAVARFEDPNESIYDQLVRDYRD